MSSGERCVTVDSIPVAAGDRPTYRIRVRGVEGRLRNQKWPPIYLLETIKPAESLFLPLDGVVRVRLPHEALRLTLAPLLNALVATGPSRVRFSLYEQVPTPRMLSLP